MYSCKPCGLRFLLGFFVSQGNELGELSSFSNEGLPDSHSFFRDAAQFVENAAGIFFQLRRGQKRGGGPGGGENAAFRSELFSPPPGFKIVKG